VQFLARENERTRFDHTKSERELGVHFRPFDEMLADVIA
jgi:dihydroflavonol-4-reductase